jgi:hypothetical protein
MADHRAQRFGDPNVAGGVMLGGARSVLTNNRLAGIPGMPVTPHFPCPKKKIHCAAITVSTCRSVRIENKPALRTDVDRDTCAHKRAGGSFDVYIGP